MPGKFEAPKEKAPIGLIIGCIAAGLAIVALVALLLIWAPWKTAVPTEPSTEATVSTQPNPENSQPGTEASDPETQPSTEASTEPPIVKEATATLSAVGDILPHMPIVRSYYFGEQGYVFDSIFDKVKPFIDSADYAIANLETTLAGHDNGYEYWGANGGVIRFNTPDSIVTALKGSGFDMLLTANNHSYDSRDVGFLRTQQVVSQMGFDYIGTRMEAQQPEYLIRDINGIRIGFLCYTYETGSGFDGWKALNGIGMNETDAPRISSFAYDDIPGFLTRVQASLSAMEAEGMDASVVFIHWGNEYQITHNTAQANIAQGLCDLGVDVIIGGHPHVIQPVELLTSAADPEHKTVCLYSAGNFISNQRFAFMGLPTAHTEDGLIFNLTFCRYSDGTVILESADILPTWVHMVYRGDGDNRIYTIYGLDSSIESWKEHYELDDWTAQELQNSYDRTMAIVGPGLSDAQEWLAQRTDAVEDALGVENTEN